MEETETEDENHTEQQDDDEATEVESGPVSGPDDAHHPSWEGTAHTSYTGSPATATEG